MLRDEPARAGDVGERAVDRRLAGAPTVLSTFSGVGGLDLGLARAGWRHVGLCEAEPYRRAVLAERFPGVPIWDDVQDVARGGDARPDERGARRLGGWNGARDAVDLLCGGFPCQDLSVAGQRRGLAGDRSGLFFEFARIAESVRPRALLIENVPGLLSSHGGRDFGELLGTLAELGYGVGWRILDSRHFGVPQRRRRVFIVGVDAGGRAGAERAGEVLALGSSCERHPPAGREAGADAPLVSLSGLGNGGPDDNDGQAGRLIAGCASEMDVAAPLVKMGGQGGGRRTTDIETATWAVNGASVRRLTPRECERLQGFPDDWTLIDWRGKPVADSLRYAALGDAVTVPVAQWLGERLLCPS
jgi:DNA (cytosine-5)-methyltransferase 1